MRLTIILCLVVLFTIVSAYHRPLFTYVSNGNTNKMSCLKLEESDPQSFNDNFLCVINPQEAISDYGIEYSYKGVLADRKCTSLSISQTELTQNINPGVVHPWSDNFLCIPFNSRLELVWTENRPSTDRFDCLDFFDTGFPHYFLCYRLEEGVNCEVSSWSEFDTCSTPCGDGTQTRLRSILQQPQNGGEACPILSERKSCKIKDCGDIGFLSTVTYYTSVLALVSFLSFLITMLAPLPGGFRNKFIRLANRAWDGSEKIRYTVIGLGLILSCTCTYSLSSLRELRGEGTRNEDMQMTILHHEQLAYISAFGVLLLVLIHRIQKLLIHYMAKAEKQ